MTRAVAPRALGAFLTAAIASVGVFTPSRANAHTAPPQTVVVRLLRNTSAGFLALETVGAVVVFATYTIAAGDHRETCSWCEPTGFDTWVRKGLVASQPKAPALASHVLSIGVVPAGVLAGLLGSAISEGHESSAWQDAWIMLNTFVLTTGITDGTKKLAARERPGFYYGRQTLTEAGDLAGERNLSFFSGDTAWAFSLAASGSALAFLHGYRMAPWIAAGSGAAASAAGLLQYRPTCTGPPMFLLAR